MLTRWSEGLFAVALKTGGCGMEMETGGRATGAGGRGAGCWTVSTAVGPEGTGGDTPAPLAPSRSGGLLFLSAREGWTRHQVPTVSNVTSLRDAPGGCWAPAQVSALGDQRLQEMPPQKHL